MVITQLLSGFFLSPSLYRVMRGVIPTGLAVGNDRRIPTSELPIQCTRMPPEF